ncbi:sensor histidine kinase [Paraburkholderia dinghuensis]|uniref:histidine kinase n=1 Tax=Paraburkholderia dinghuensis TaxID=2305225 RepID=A0A3N6N9F7_9BURK|nr:HAMP domain-containing sensor histidine kinase [Paraburkholderia dinghuensis]RQH05672.1 sensor histidine kinase [Paraburkholderia dinghuensis]
MAPTPDTRSERIARLCAETALFMRDHVLSRVSHDLRSPLNAIHSWAYVLERKIDAVDATAQRALGGIRTGVEQQVQLLEALVDKTRVETRTLRIDRAPFALDALIDEATDDVRVALADARAVTLTVQCTPTGATVDGDRERIVQALWLMLMFAVESSAHDGGATLDVSATAASAHFDVKWTAAPQALTDEALPHLLEPFARAQAREPLEVGRAAWVLSLCQRVAEAHGGHFEQQPLTEGETTALVLTLPLAPA